ncbi:Crp/Fnr family transcriptional regulator [Leptolyngbya sp. FACHB-261]|uniref:Crp/Fnr family transcriptional regulator n=1 Tax=Leptolyngbya sp. FACHB-261 TaxID=2692806 RepID=UPI0016854168|nr:Crp/Fnr family transcriptional regulator [Leptolyngbya sp. FACHB-261]MBD2102243.1 Crp/Fnr family transcriptional regulator [Leptolyngbya sp. FACHB-261]
MKRFLSESLRGKPFFNAVASVACGKRVGVSWQTVMMTSTGPVSVSDALHYYTYSEGSSIDLVEPVIFYIDSGLVMLCANTPEEGDYSVGILGPGMVFGRTIADEGCQAVALVTTQLRALASTQTIADLNLLNDALIARLRHTHTLLEVANQRPVMRRFCSLLEVLGNHLGRTTPQGVLIDVRLTHQQLATLIGSTRVTITRMLGELKDQGVVCQMENQRLLLRRAA